MKKLNFIFTYVFLFSISFVQSQEENQNSKFSIIAYGGIGYTKVQNDLELDYDLNVNTAEILINYKIWNDIGIASGIGYSELSGAGYNSTGNFYHERNVVKIPLLLTANKNFSENLVIFANFGFYGQTIVKDEFRYLLTTRDDIYEGLNFGAQLGLGLGYQIDERFAIGFNLSAQSDFNSFETTNNTIVNNKQKHKNLTTVGIFGTISL